MSYWDSKSFVIFRILNLLKRLRITFFWVIEQVSGGDSLLAFWDKLLLPSVKDWDLDPWRNFEDRTVSLSRNVGEELPPLAAQ